MLAGDAGMYTGDYLQTGCIQGIYHLGYPTRVYREAYIAQYTSLLGTQGGI